MAVQWCRASQCCLFTCSMTARAPSSSLTRARVQRNRELPSSISANPSRATVRYDVIVTTRRYPSSRVTHPGGSDTIGRMRIVSLLPSTTEILFDIGAGDDVVGVTFECDHPPEARERRIVSTSALPEGLDSAGIDAFVTAAMRAGEDLYHLDEGALSGLDADLVVTQDLCAVCAVDVTRGRRRAGPSRVHRRGADDRPAHPRRGARLDRGARAQPPATRLRPSTWSPHCERGSTGSASRWRRGPPERHRGCCCSSGPTRPSRRATGCRRWSRPPAAYPRSVRRARSRCG